MTTLTLDVDVPGGVDPESVRTTVTLWGAGVPVVGHEIGTGKMIAGLRTADGPSVSIANLVGNDDIDLPAGTVYRVEVAWAGLPDPVVMYVDLPTSGTHNVASILTDPPGALASSALSAAIAAETARSTLETLGAQVDQTAAIAVRTRFLDFYRDAGGPAPTATRNNLGGDVTDVKHIASSDDVIVVGADWFDSGINAVVNDLFTTQPLPQRSGGIIAPTPNSFVGATQLYASGFSGVWLDAVAQAGLPAGTILWPIAVIDDANTLRVACWHVESPAANGAPHGRLIDSIIVTLHVFLGYQSHVSCGFGALSNDFWVCGMWRDDNGFTYVNGMEFVPRFDARTTANPAAPNYVLDNPDAHYSLTRIARVANGSLNTIASWTFWNGSGWVPGVANAVPIKDIAGNPIPGDMGIRKVTTDRYSAVAHPLTASHLASYASTVPQGPYWPTALVPLPEMGRDIPGGRTVGQLCKILPPQFATPPRRCSFAMVSQNVIGLTGYSVTPPWTRVAIDTFAPVIVAFPDY